MRYRRQCCLGLAASLGTALFFLAAAAYGASGGTGPSKAIGQPAGLTLALPIINGRALDHSVFVALGPEGLSLSTTFLRSVGLKNVSTTATFANTQFTTLASIPRLHGDLRESEGRIYLTCPPECFVGIGISLRENKPVVETSTSRSAFLNYDATVQFQERNRKIAAFVETGIAGRNTLLTNTMTCRSAQSEDTCARLETSASWINPSTMRRLTIGDEIAAGGSGQRPFQFGGIRWGTDFSTRPTFVSFPTPILRGALDLPGTAEIYVNDVLTFDLSIDQGPFEITDIPTVSGQGSAEVIVTDILGRQSRISTEFYAAPELLRPGLSAYSIEAGAARQHFGLRSFTYGEEFIAANLRRGINGAVTVGVQTLIASPTQSLSTEVAMATRWLGVVNMNAGAVRQGDDIAGRFSIGHAWRSERLSLGGSASVMSQDLVDFPSDRPLPDTDARVFFGVNGPAIGSTTINWVYGDDRGSEPRQSLGGRHTRSFGRLRFDLSGFRVFEPEPGFAVGLSLTAPLGQREFVSAETRSTGDEMRSLLRLQRQVVRGRSLGYDLVAATGKTDRYEGRIEYRSAFGDISAAAAHTQYGEAVRISARGGLGLAGGRVAAAPAITDSFAIVDLGDIPNIRVYHNRQLVGRTNSEGEIVLASLNSFEDNVLTFDARDLPIDTSYRSHQYTIVPGRRSGHYVSFDVKRTRSLSGWLVDERGQPVAPGGRLENVDTGRAYPMGRGGRLYIEDAVDSLVLRYTVDDRVCIAWTDIGHSTSHKPYTDIGRLTCRSVPEGWMQ